MWWWKEFEEGEVEEDFRKLSQIPLSPVRIFLLWEDFQETPRKLREDSLRALHTVFEIAGDYRLQLVLSLFTGHMSGANWLPLFALEDRADPSQRFPVITGDTLSDRVVADLYTDPTLLEAQALLLTTLAARYQNHPVLAAWDLGNETSNLRRPQEVGHFASWLQWLTAALRRYDERHPITLGCHGEDLEEDRHFRFSVQSRYLDFISLHAYPMYLDWARGPSDSAVLAFLAHLCRTFAGKPVQVQEFGTPLPPATHFPGLETRYQISPEAGLQFYREALEGMWRSGVYGALCWCYIDYAEALWSREPLRSRPHERFFGIYDAQGNPKPAVEEIRRFASERRPVLEAPSLTPLPSEEIFFTSPRRHLPDLYLRFVEAWSRLQEAGSHR